MYKVPKNAKLILYVHGQELTGLIDYVDKKDITVSGVSSINNILRELYAKEGKTFAELINEGRVVIDSPKVWDKYDLLSNMLFAKVGKTTTKKTSTEKPEEESEKDSEEKPDEKSEEKPEEPEKKPEEPGKKPEEPEKKPEEPGKKPEEPGKKPEEESEDDLEMGEDGAYDPLPAGKDSTKGTTDKKEGKKEKSKKVSLRTVCFRTLAAAGAMVVTWVGLSHLNRYFSKKNAGNTQANNDKRIVVDINEDGKDYHTTYNLPSDDEEFLTTIIVNPDDEAVYIEEETPKAEEEHVEYVPENIVGHDFTSLGSIIQFDDMQTQLDVIDKAAVEREPFSFENLVVADDYDAIHALNTLKEDAISKNDDYTNHQYMETLINYVFNKGNYINGNFVEEFNSLHPFGQYIVIRMSQGQLMVCKDVVNEQLLNEYDEYGDILYRELLGLTNHK